MYKILYVSTIEYVIQQQTVVVGYKNNINTTPNQIKLRMPLFVTMMFSSVQLVNVMVINKGFFIVGIMALTDSNKYPYQHNFNSRKDGYQPPICSLGWQVVVLYIQAFKIENKKF